ncbi:MAG: DUF4199 domain-containing protein [Saprospiraceae bacterium]|nr:DUF4199 domain-containing protein [Saprospiraceae bacterium]
MLSLENPAVKNGIIAGLATAGLILFFYLFNPRWVFSVASILTTILFIVFMVRSVKEEKSGLEFMAFNDALKPAFVTYVVANLIYIIFYYVLLNFIAPELVEMQREIAIETIEKMSGLIGEEGTEAALDQMDQQSFEFSLKSAALAFAWGLIFPGFIVSLIIAAIMKDKKPVDTL